MPKSLFQEFPRPWSVKQADPEWPENACILDANGGEVAWNAENSADCAALNLTHAQALELVAIVNAAP